MEKNKITVLLVTKYKNFVLFVQSFNDTFQYVMSNGSEIYQGAVVITDIKTENHIENAVKYLLNAACTTIDYLEIKDDPKKVEEIVKKYDLEIEALEMLPKALNKQD